jgi:hypothetical protein
MPSAKPNPARPVGTQPVRLDAPGWITRDVGEPA